MALTISENSGQALRCHQELQQYLLPDVFPTGRLLGSGSYGTVEELSCKHCICAGKKLDKACAKVDWEELAQRYLRECQMMSSLQHPSVAKFYGIFFPLDAQLPLLVMEKLEVSLDDVLKHETGLPFSFKHSVLKDVACALLYLHDKKPPVIHGDLTVANVLFDSSEKVKITMGSSRLRSGQGSACTGAYAPLEVCENSQHCGTSTDIYGFGALAQQTLTQDFRSDTEAESLLDKLVTPLCPAVVQLVKQCLCSDPIERPSSQKVHTKLQSLRELAKESESSFKLDMTRLRLSIESKKKDKKLEELAHFQGSISDTKRLEWEVKAQRNEIQVLQKKVAGLKGDADHLRELLQNMSSQVLSQFLFPAATKLKHMGDRSGDCRTIYNFLTEVCTENYSAFSTIVHKLILMHHEYDSILAKQWEFEPPGRSKNGYVGLQNAGATGYMNVILQQLFMIPSFRDDILNIETSEKDESIVTDMQYIFGHLMHSKLQYYTPKRLWENFRLYNEPIDVTEPQDAFFFFESLSDQVDKVLKKKGCSPVFQKTFEITLQDKKICRGCEHTYDRGDSYLELCVDTKGKKNLENSLKDYVTTDTFNGFLCEKCNEKREVVRRCCIKVLPPVLLIRLMRFSYDWIAEKSVKCCDHFEFPWLLDMEPYTSEGLARQEEVVGGERPYYFELVGITVHDSKHSSMAVYYAFVKDQKTGLWLKCYNTSVEIFDLNDATIEAECFGGTYMTSKGPTTRQCTPTILWYKKVDVVADIEAQRKNIPGSLSQRHSIPRKVLESIDIENLQAEMQSQIFCPQYFDFIYELTKKTSGISCLPNHTEQTLFGEVSMKLAAHFLFNTFFKATRSLRAKQNQWIQMVQDLLLFCKAACAWLIEHLASPEGRTNYLKLYLLDCPNKETRQSFCKVLSSAVVASINHEGKILEPVAIIVDYLIAIMAKDVEDHGSAEYFEFFKVFAEDPLGCKRLLEKDLLFELVRFLIGPSLKTQLTAQKADLKPSKPKMRNPNEFGALHITFSILIWQVDISEAGGGKVAGCSAPIHRAKGVKLTPMTSNLKQALFTSENTKKFIEESIVTVRESDTAALAAVTSTLCCCCCNNETFSACTIEGIQQQLTTTHTVRKCFRILTEILLINDSLQHKRISLAFASNNQDGSLFCIIKTSSSSSQTTGLKRTYEGIKFLVGLANKSKIAKDFLESHASRWTWISSWLKQRVLERESKADYKLPARAAHMKISPLEEANAFLIQLEHLKF